MNDSKIRIAICGYGNLGKGAEREISKNSDMELIGIFTRRDPNSIQTETGVKAISIQEMEKWKDKIDVVLLCGGSATDLPIQGPQFAEMFNTIDSYDTHAKIPEYYEKVDKAAKKGNNLSMISGGWDPGLFSINRLYAESVLTQGNTYTFWGDGVSQGHSDAIRRVKGVKDAIQYTIPKKEALESVRNGENPELTTRQKHLRRCYVVLEEGADEEKVTTEIKTMPNYFSDYDTEVIYITEEELKKNHSKMSHGGFVLRSGTTGEGNHELIEYSLKLDSNPEFTSSVLICYARAIYRLHKQGKTGAVTVFDIPPYLLSQKSREEIIKDLL